VQRNGVDVPPADRTGVPLIRCQQSKKRDEPLALSDQVSHVELAHIAGNVPARNHASIVGTSSAIG
jgi:hypothetical protein